MPFAPRILILSRLCHIVDLLDMVGIDMSHYCHLDAQCTKGLRQQGNASLPNGFMNWLSENIPGALIALCLHATLLTFLGRLPV